MSKVIDLQLSLPPSMEEIISLAKLFTLGRGEKGMANYRNIFWPEKARSLGLTLEELDKMSDELPLEEPVPGMLAVRLGDVEALHVGGIATELFGKQARVVVEIPVVEGQAHLPVDTLQGAAALLQNGDL